MGLKRFFFQRVSNYINRKVYNYGLKKAKWDRIHTIYFKIIDVNRKYDNVPLKTRIKMYKNHFRSDDYINYNLEGKNLDDYMTELERWNTRKINGEYNVCFDNKNIFYEMFKDYLNIPHNIGVLKDCKITDDEGNEISLDDLLAKWKKIVIKPTVGGGGHEIHMLEKDNDGYLLDDNHISANELQELFKRQQESIISNFIIQHEYAKKLYPHSTNTIRVITIKDPETGKYMIPYAIQRIGCDASRPVDNVCNGGYFAHVDVDTGIIKKARSYDHVEPVSTHPDCGSQIEGVQIPHWEEMKEKLLKVASRFSYIPFTAWDVVITDDGFGIIEGNASTGLGIIQMEEGLKPTKLGEFYKAYNTFEK